MKKYYFITYIGKHRKCDIDSTWHAIIDVSPMEYIKQLLKSEEEAPKNGRDSYYYDFYIINTERITKKEYDKWKGRF